METIVWDVKRKLDELPKFRLVSHWQHLITADVAAIQPIDELDWPHELECRRYSTVPSAARSYVYDTYLKYHRSYFQGLGSRSAVTQESTTQRPRLIRPT